MRRPFVVTIAVLGATAGCSNPPYVDLCPAERPSHGTACDNPQVSCSYSAPGCEGSTSARVRVTCEDRKWVHRSEGVSCNPPFWPEDTGVADSGTCPKSEPAIGAACTGSDRCSYNNLCPLPGAAGIPTNVYRCAGGKWTFENNLESPIECPKMGPRDGEPCGCAMYLPAACLYVGACGSDSAKCDGATQRWIVTPGMCDAGADGG
jgi:hypothetical protein